MKIVIAVEEFDPDKGYLEYHLAEELTKLGHKVYVFTFGRGKREARPIVYGGFKIFRLPHFASLNGYHMPSLSGVTHILRFLKAERPDIVHCQPIDSPLSLFFVSWSSFFKYKIVGPIMSQLNIVFSPWNITKKILFCISKIIVNKYAAKKSQVIFAKSRGLTKILCRSYNVPENKFHIIPLGTDPELFKFNPTARNAIRKDLGLSLSDVMIVYSGKIDPTKGLETLLNALSPIIAANKKVKFLVIGTGKPSYVESVRKLAEDLEISNNVFFSSWVKRSLLSDYYSASDIAVWPGLSSISIVDAASVGLPLVIANVPVEVFAINNKNGFTFELGNVNELRAKLKILTDSETLRREMGRKSRCLVENRLNWKFVTMKYLDAYRDALSPS